MSKTPSNVPLKLRSREWFGKLDRWGLAHRAWLRAEGFSERVFQGKPVIGICNSWSELNNCNAHLRQVAEAVKRGVWEAGGFPLEFPTISLGEMLMKPTTILYRNLMRSEEHTSELQSRPHLVCRLLLEKKKTIRISAD